MKKETFSTIFFIRKGRVRKTGVTPISMRLTVNGISAEITTHKSIQPELWDSRKERAIGKDSITREINKHIETLITKVLLAHRQLEIDNKPITLAAIKDLMQGKKSAGRSLVETYKEHNDQISQLIGTEFSKVTVRRYVKSLETIVEFMQYQYKISDIELTEIEPKFVNDYEVYLKSKCKCSHNTVVKKLKQLKKIINIALINDWIKRDPFRNIKLREECKEKEFLVKEEIEMILSKKIKLKRLEQVRDIYCFAIFTGLAFTDIMNLRPEHIIKDNSGNMWIRKARQKTKNMCNIPLLEIPISIIEKYKDNPVCEVKGSVLPPITNQRFNGYLQEIADLCGIKKHLTSHTARHSWATLCLTNGVSMESVAKMLGHSSTRMTQHYARILDTKIDSELEVLRGQFNKIG